jgi:hypothetical protein
MSRVARKVANKRVLALIGRFLRAGVWIEGTVQPTELGTPQGGPSPHCSPISSWMTSTKSSNVEAFGSLATRMTSWSS